jgi:hypothetical protein
VILGILIGLVAGLIIATWVFGAGRGGARADLEASKFRLEQENWRLEAEAAQRGEIS